MKSKIILSAAAVIAAVGLCGAGNFSDITSFGRFLLGDGDPPAECDLCPDGRLDVYDLVMMRKQISAANIVRVTNTDELKAALTNASAGDEIVVASGEYVYSGSTPKGRMFHGAADGTSTSPIILRGEDPDDPPVISGVTVEGSYALTITGDWWILRDLKVTNASKGIIVDNSDHTQIINCEVYNIGAEGIHLRDDSSYCLVESCRIHDTGIISPAYGEGVYVGSSKSTTGYGYSCDYNTIRNCKIGPNVAAEHVDVKEYTTGTVIEHCIFDGTGMSGENYADSFVDLKGNDCILRYCTAYRNGCENINRAFEMNRLAEGWGQNALIYGNTAYMDVSVAENGKKMVILNSWDCTETVWDNYMAYEDGIPFLCEKAHYNCNGITFKDE